MLLGTIILEFAEAPLLLGVIDTVFTTNGFNFWTSAAFNINSLLPFATGVKL